MRSPWPTRRWWTVRFGAGVASEFAMVGICVVGVGWSGARVGWFGVLLE